MYILNTIISEIKKSVGLFCELEQSNIIESKWNLRKAIHKVKVSQSSCYAISIFRINFNSFIFKLITNFKEDLTIKSRMRCYMYLT